MRRAISHLAELGDDRLFGEVADGIRLILENAESYDETAHRLALLKEFRASGMAGRLAEEESAKVLILLDAVRCPRNVISQTLKCFYSHLAKGIYASACSWRPSTYGDMSHYVDVERSQFYLDGPEDVDWICSNAITTDRERAMYVDYVQDITEDAGECSWLSPLSHHSAWCTTSYRSPKSLIVVREIRRIGATTPDGLAIVAKVWRDFIPEAPTTRSELRGRIGYMGQCLSATELCLEGYSVTGKDTLLDWHFPLWSLDLTKSKRVSLEELRNTRKDHMNWRTGIEAMRDPPPTITSAKVREMSKAFAVWDQEMKMLVDAQEGNESTKNGLRVIPSCLSDRFHDLSSYKRLESMLIGLTDGERTDLVALGWFGRPEVLSWPDCHRQARESSSNLHYKYQTGLGGEWLEGLERWESNSKA